MDIPRLVNAWEPNPNSGIVYTKLESSILHYMMMYKEHGLLYVQFGPDDDNASIEDRMAMLFKKICGTIEDISDTSVKFVMLESPYADIIESHWKTCRIGFSYLVDKPSDPMSLVRVIKPILYL